MIRLALSLVLAFGAASATAQTMPSPDRMRTALAPVATQTDHLILVQTMGDGPPVLLIPGLASPRDVWDGLRPELARTHKVILAQVRGFDGDDPGRNDEAGMLVGIVADLARELAPHGKVAVIGHSMGGLIGMKLAAEHPQLVDRLMVVDALPFIGALFDPAATAQSVAPQAAAMRDAVARGTPPARTRPVTADPGGIWSNTAEGRIRVANWSRMAQPAAVAQATYDVFTTDLRPALKSIAARPFTVLYATGAGPQARTIWEREYAGSPATLVPVADSWHFIMLDQPAAFRTEVERFLAE